MSTDCFKKILIYYSWRVRRREALDGKGDGNDDKKITVKEVEIWLNERVPELSEKFSGAAQYPNSFAQGQDFPIGLLE